MCAAEAASARSAVQFCVYVGRYQRGQASPVHKGCMSITSAALLTALRPDSSVDKITLW